MKWILCVIPVHRLPSLLARPEDDDSVLYAYFLYESLSTIQSHFMEWRLTKPAEHFLSAVPKTPSEQCLFGNNCYRRNPHHFKEYAHPHLQKLIERYGRKIPDDADLSDFDVAVDTLREQVKVYGDVFKCGKVKATREENSSVEAAPSTSQVQKKKISIIEKLERAKPFSYFLTKVQGSPTTHNDYSSIFMAELLHPSLGKLKKSLQINFMVQIDWLQMNYEVMHCADKPLLILYGEENPELHQSRLPSNIRAIRIRSRFPFGTHHTKMMLLQYEDDSVRVVILTANLIDSDWENRTQGLWVSPRCPKMDSNSKSDGDSPTGFKASLIRYLQYYEVSTMNNYVDAVKACDFSSVNVFLIASVPNAHKGADIKLWGHSSVSSILRKHCDKSISDWPLILQCSSIGKMGNNEAAWFKGELGHSLTATGTLSGNLPPVHMIYPSKLNVEKSYDGLLGGGCLPYSRKTHSSQTWLEKYLCSWRSVSRHRDRAMPHIKTYTRISPDCTKAAYFLLTSANMSKAAWGSLNKAKDSLMVMSYEAGVLFIPKFVNGKDYFELGKDFDLPYDVPVQEYKPEESVWFMDYLREAI